ncbi:hypothetical protein ACWX0K_10940 [Nitrobacteraceae bacterium UC4446_H13]
MCPWLKPDTSGAEAATRAAQAQADKALTAQLQAKLDTQKGADTSSEGARAASEAAVRRLAAGGMWGVGVEPDKLPAGSVFTRELIGS